jgi:zinc transport system substrate-binding protein
MCILYGALPALGEKSGESTYAEGSIRIFVSINPQSSLVERIGGEPLKATVLVQPGQDPHLYEPMPSQMVALSEADIYFGIGLPFEERILNKVRSSNPDLFVVQTDRGIRRRILEEYNHDNGEGGPDPHIWLGPHELEMLARNIYEGLVQIDPDHEVYYRRNHDIFVQELHAVDERLQKLLAPYRGRPFFVFHPSFGYFADTYGLVQVPVEIEGKSPTPKQIEAIIERAREEGVRIIFVQPQFDQRSAEAIAAALRGTVVTIDPLGRDVLQNLEILAQSMEESMR